MSEKLVHKQQLQARMRYLEQAVQSCQLRYLITPPGSFEQGRAVGRAEVLKSELDELRQLTAIENRK